MVLLQDMSINLPCFLELIKKGNSYTAPCLDDYKEHEYELLRIKMSTAVNSSAYLSHDFNQNDNKAALVCLVALFYKKGDVREATTLLESFHT